MGAGISADGTRSDNSYLPTHAFLPALLAAEASAPGLLFTTVERRRAVSNHGDEALVMPSRLTEYFGACQGSGERRENR
jgi:hypothetical protein